MNAEFNTFIKTDKSYPEGQQCDLIRLRTVARNGRTSGNPSGIGQSIAVYSGAPLSSQP